MHHVATCQMVEGISRHLGTADEYVVAPRGTGVYAHLTQHHCHHTHVAVVRELHALAARHIR